LVLAKRSKDAEPRETAVARGRRCEALAQVYLEELGYQIIARNHRCQGGEVDLIAYDAGILCFVEVRARSTEDYGSPLETIDARKIRRIVRASADFLQNLTGLWPPMRFDALGIVLRDPPEYTLIRAAFEA
jgi:putative endonuclease